MKFEHLKYSKIINAYLDNLKSSFVKENPDKVVYSNRNCKVWIDESDKNIPLAPMSVAKALKAGYNNSDNIKIIKTKIIKGYEI